MKNGEAATVESVTKSEKRVATATVVDQIARVEAVAEDGVEKLGEAGEALYATAQAARASEISADSLKAASAVIAKMGARSVDKAHRKAVEAAFNRRLSARR